MLQRLLGHPRVADILYGRATRPGRIHSPADEDDDDYNYYTDPQVGMGLRVLGMGL